MNEQAPGSEETIFSTALQMRSVAERRAYLDMACSGDAEVRRRVEALLDAHPGLGDFMEDLPAGEAIGPQGTLRLANVADEAPGTRIGRYKLLQKLGEGGCGVVYMAEQEEPVRRFVALKVIKLGMDTKSVIARFEAERQALAMMDHPNIAKVLDAGATETGRPYFVMELVRGIKITEFCDQNRLSTRERLDLFVQVCQAVQHAHQKGIIHRDLKPSNVLVTIHDPGGPGVPMIIDFGIAKATQGRLTDQTLFTAFEQFLGTPAYMSPEQAMMTVLDVDTRSDIYSLGVLLYELLTGRTPFDAKELLASGFEEMRRTIREKEPLRPSTRLSTLLAAEQATAASVRQTEPPKLVHLVRGDLDWIVMKCLEKDRARRYETANALAMDLRRHVNQEPVVARPPSRVYRAQKWVRRNKGLFTGLAAVMLALSAGLGLAMWAWAREQGARKLADQNAQLARRRAYVSEMNSAQQALQAGNLGRARELLTHHVPKPGEPDLRQWEWRYLARECRGDPHASLPAFSKRVSNVRFLDNGTLLATGYTEPRTRIWDWRKGRVLRVLTNHSGGLYSLALWPEQHGMVWRNAWAGTADLWQMDLQTGREERLDLIGPEGTVGTVAISSDGQRLALGRFSTPENGRAHGRVEIWDVNSRAKAGEFSLGEYVRPLVRFSPNGKLLAAIDTAGQLTFWNVERGLVLARTNAYPAETWPMAAEFSPDGDRLVTCGNNWVIKLWDVNACAWIRDLPNPGRHFALAFSRDGRRLASGGADTDLRLWDTKTWTVERTLRGHVGEVETLDFSPDSQWLASGSRTGEVFLWPLERTPETPGTPRHVAFEQSAWFTLLAPDGSGFARALRGYPPQAELWSPLPFRRLWQRPLTPQETNAIMGLLLPGSQRLLLALWPGGLHLKTLAEDQTLAAADWTPRPDSVWGLSADGSTLVSSSRSDKTVRVWRLPALESLGRRVVPHEYLSLAVSDDGCRVALFTGRGTIEIWRLPALTGPPPLEAYGRAEDLTGCFSPDGRRLAVACSDHTAHIWDVDQLRPVITLPSTASRVDSLAFSRDGRRLAVGTREEILLFDAFTAEEVASLRIPDSGAVQVRFTPDGNGLIAIGANSAHAWLAPPFAELTDDWLKPEHASRTP